VDRKVKSQIQVVHAVEDQRLALSQTQAPSLGHHRILGQEIQRGGMMPLADFPQMAVAGKHLSAAQYGSRPRNGVVIPKADGGGTHVTSTFDDGAPAWTTPLASKLRCPLLFQHADSGNWQKLTIPSMAGDYRSSPRITPTANHSVATAHPHSWYLLAPVGILPVAT